MKVLPIRPLSPEWHAYREKRISGSTVGAVLGESKWSSPLSEWARIVGNAPPEEVNNPYADWGNATEPMHRAWLADDEGLEVEPVSGIVPHPTIEWCCFSPDGAAYEAERAHPILPELKAPSPWTADEWDEKLDMQYQTQVQFGMACCEVGQSILSVILPPKRDPLGAFVGALAWHFSHVNASIYDQREELIRRGFTRRSYYVEENPRLQAAMFARLEKWWEDHVVGMAAPPATASKRDKDVLGLLGSDNPRVDFDEKAAALVGELDVANAAYKAAEERKQQLQNTLTQRAGAKTWAEAKKAINRTRRELRA